MKKIFYLALAAIMLFSFSGCQKVTTAGMTRITYYPVITLEGESYMVVDKGSTFVDPGFSATLNGKDVTSEVKVSSNVNTAKSGVYTISYTAINEDGFSTSSKRTVVVLDAGNPVEGFYLTDPSCNRNGTAYGKQFEILIIGEGDGLYTIEDVLAGWYCQRAGYGSNYAMEAQLLINEDGKVELQSSYIPGWGDGLDSFEGTYDFSAGKLEYTALYATTLKFNVVLVKE